MDIIIFGSGKEIILGVIDRFCLRDSYSDVVWWDDDSEY